MSKKTRSLGRGLGALLPEQPLFQSQDNEEEAIHSIQLNKIIPNVNQPRREFDLASLQELSESIREYGVIQPIIVVTQGAKYMIVAGERRFRAAQMANLETVPCIVRALSDTKVLELALIENIQREDLMPLEEAAALQMLTEQLAVSKADLARRLGKSRSYVSNIIRLLTLPADIQFMLASGQISSGHARALLSIEDEELMLTLAKEIVDKNLSVRQIENLARKQRNHAKDEKKDSSEQTNDDKLRELVIRDMESSLKSLLKTQVVIKDSQNKGQILIEYYSDEDLERLIKKLSFN